VKVEREIELDAPREEVYRLLMDPNRLGEWVTIHEGFEGSPDELSQGTEMTQHLKVAGRRFSVRWKVTGDDRPSRVTWEGQGPARTNARVIYDLEESDGGTRFTYVNEYELPGGAAGRIAGRAVSGAAGREVERSLERLKGLVED
jgi:carbon monoxide dehydrogenase subunit G